MSQKCPILPNWSTRKDGTCKRFRDCEAQGRTRDSKCPAKGAIK